MGKAQKSFLLGGILLVFFVVFTILVKTINVKPVGPENSLVGFAGFNESFSNTIGVNSFWYILTKVIGYGSLIIMTGFALLGLFQLVKGKSLKAVSPEILCLGVYYAVVILVYAFFEKVVINYRPVIADSGKGLEASYPSSQTVLIIAVLGSIGVMLSRLLDSERVSLARGIALSADVVIVVAIIGRTLSGALWFTDIVGGMLIAFALLYIFRGVIFSIEK